MRTKNHVMFKEQVFDNYDDARVWMEGYIKDPAIEVHAAYLETDDEFKGRYWEATVRYSKRGAA